MNKPIHHDDEPLSNALRDDLVRTEPRSLRTFTPTQAVLSKSAGVFHWTPEGKRLYDYSSGVLVANLGHNPSAWMRRFFGHMGWKEAAALVVKSLEKAIADKVVTYDFARLMPGATQVSCSGFGNAMIERM